MVRIKIQKLFGFYKDLLITLWGIDLDSDRRVETLILR